MIWTTEFSGKFPAKARFGDCFSSYTATDLGYLKEKEQPTNQTKPKELIATWLGSCSTSPPCGSSKNPARDPCGGQETSRLHGLVLPKQKVEEMGQGYPGEGELCAAWAGATWRWAATAFLLMTDPTGKHLHHLWWGVHTAVSLLLWLPTPPDSSFEKFILGDHSCRGEASKTIPTCLLSLLPLGLNMLILQR